MLSLPLYRTVSLWWNTSFASFKQYKRKNSGISLLQLRKQQSSHHPPHRDYLHPKKFYLYHPPRGRFAFLSIYLPLVWWTEILKISACILKLFPPLFESGHIRSFSIIEQSLLLSKLFHFYWYEEIPNHLQALWKNKLMYISAKKVISKTDLQTNTRRNWYSHLCLSHIRSLSTQWKEDKLKLNMK